MRATAVLGVLLAAAVFVPAALCRSGPDLGFPSASVFTRIAQNGLDGDKGNSYPWTMKYFKRQIVVCTLRHSLAQLAPTLALAIPGSMSFAAELMNETAVRYGNDPRGQIIPPCSLDWAEQMAARCYVYNDTNATWDLVFKSPLKSYKLADALALRLQVQMCPGKEPYWFPEVGGIRWGLVTQDSMGRQGSLYVVGVGVFSVGVPWTRVYRTTTAKFGEWEDWTGATEAVVDPTTGGVLPANVWDLSAVMQPRDILQVSGHICVPGCIYSGAFDHLDAAAMRPTIHCRDPSAGDSKWVLRTEPSVPARNPFPDSSSAFQTSKRFAGKIFWGMQNNVGDAVSVWTSDDGFDRATGKLQFKQFAANAFGDLSYSTPFITETCGQKLMIGLSNPAGYFFNGRKVTPGTRGSALYSVDAHMRKEYVIGDPYATGENSPSGKATFLGWPTSLAFAGLDNPTNHYFWSAQQFRNLWFMGTFDSASVVVSALLPSLNVTLPMVGADLWVTSDCKMFRPVTMNGFGNNHNYGVRTMLVAPQRGDDQCLLVGMANPFTFDERGGAEIYEWCP